MTTKDTQCVEFESREAFRSGIREIRLKLNDNKLLKEFVKFVKFVVRKKRTLNYNYTIIHYQLYIKPLTLNPRPSTAR